MISFIERCYICWRVRENVGYTSQMQNYRHYSSPQPSNSSLIALLLAVMLAEWPHSLDSFR